jgi:Zn-dependent membrane protease YugP
MFFDSYFLILVAPAMLLSIIAQCMVKSSFSKYSQIPSAGNITGRDAATALLRAASVCDVSVESIEGTLTDHYDPRQKTLRLSLPVYGGNSVAAIGVAAHETGHALQDAESYSPLVLRSSLVPVANIGSSLGPIIAMAGIFFSFPFLLKIGIVLFSCAVLFYIITLPVEFNASARALIMLRNNNILTEEELNGVKKVLTAAALTYVASALTAIMSLIRLLLIARDRER